MDAPVLPPATEPEKSTPLLPPVLLGPAAILWLWVLPILVLLAINLQGYQLIEGNMDAAQHSRAHLFGLVGVLNLLIGLGLYVSFKRCLLRQPEATGIASVWWALPAIVVQVAYLWLAVSWGLKLLPDSVTNWIYPETRFVYYQFAFAMPPLFWGILRLACARPAKNRGRSLLFNLTLAVAAPVLLYVVFRVMGALSWWSSLPDLGPYVVAVLIIVLGVLMFLGMIRGLALGLRNIDSWRSSAERIAILIFALALPMGGLWLNRTMPFPNDFQAWEVYALTAVNAAILLLASWQHERRPLLSLGLLCATLPFTLYFFVVFLPFLPLSILATIVFGVGFLVLTPTVLLILHLSLLSKARRGSSGRRLVTGALCFLLMPGFFTVRGLADKAALNAALDYVYTPAIKDGPIRYPASLTNLRRALSNHRAYKNGIYYPLLSDYYAWLVFDDLVLSDDKLARLENAFFGAAGSSKNKDPLRQRDNFFGGGSSVRDRNRMPRSAPPPRTVTVEKLGVRMAPAEGGATVVTLALTLRNTGSLNAEFVKTLPLPAGVYVNGFRLCINGVAVPGRITEKKTALWVYSMIRDSERRDPGLLFYNAPGELELRVFPVAAQFPSVVEIDFLVPASLPVDAPLADASNDAALVLAKLDGLLHPQLVQAGRESIVAGGLDALSLPPVMREPYLHVIVDRSADNGFDGDLAAILRVLRKKFPEARMLRVTLANYETAELPSESASLGALPLRGGFVPDLALAQALRKHQETDLDASAADAPPASPVFVILSRKTTPYALNLEVARAWSDVVPALDIRQMDASGRFTTAEATPAREAPLLRLGHSMRPLLHGRAVSFKMAGSVARLEYWSPESASWRPVNGAVQAADGTPWARAVALQARQQEHDRTPGDAANNLKTLVKESRESGVMLASTSYIVVENAAQWRMLDVSERKKLDQNTALNFKEAPAPSAVWLIPGFGLWLWLRRRKSLRSQRR